MSRGSESGIVLREKFREVLQKDFSAFVEAVMATVDPGTAYLHNWHIDLIGEYLDKARRGEIHRLIINMPPRSLKSLCVSVAWPAWLLGHDPTSRIIAASYAASLAVKHSIDCRTVITSPWYCSLFKSVTLSRDQNEKHKFMTRQRGFRFATSVGGSTTGEGGNYLIIDDPISPAQAASKNWRDSANHWFDHTFASRLDDKQKGVIVLVMQRLHANDMTGYLLAKGGWTHLSLPAVAVKREVFYAAGRKIVREPGQLLHPQRENQLLIERAKTELGSSAFAAQYQQRPLAEEGNMVHPWWFLRYAKQPVCVRKIQSWDTGVKGGARHDASVCLTFGECDGKNYLLDTRVMRLEYPDLKRMVYMLAEQWQPDAILIEDKASGQQLLQDVRRETQLPLIARMPKGDKITRFAAVSAMIEAGRVALPEQAPWLSDFEQEILLFPHGEHDDQVDALTQYLDWIRISGLNALRIRRL